MVMFNGKKKLLAKIDLISDDVFILHSVELWHSYTLVYVGMVNRLWVHKTIKCEGSNTSRRANISLKQVIFTEFHQNLWPIKLQQNNPQCITK